MKSVKVCLFFVGLCLAAAWSVGSANAVPVAISDQVFVNGVLVATFAEGTAEPPFVTTINVGASGAGAWAALTEPGTGALSDVAVVNSDGFIVFASDDENGNFPAGTPPRDPNFFLGGLVETGDLQDIGIFFDLGQNVLVVSSDLGQTPLPAALPLFVGGAGLLGFLARRRKRKDAFAVAG